jgi:hypothetical protein
MWRVPDILAIALTFFLAIVGVCLFACLVCNFWRYIDVFQRNRLLCKNNLHNSSSAILDAVGQTGKREQPERLAEYWLASDTTKAHFVCPGPCGNRPLAAGESWTNISEWTTYVYVHWAGPYSQIPKDYPIMYDKSLKNHQGKGINILMADTSVFWDRDARWLQRFAAEHPEQKIVLPDGVTVGR